jgi:ACS family glucarate transporter-like MFS transporter
MTQHPIKVAERPDGIVTEPDPQTFRPADTRGGPTEVRRAIVLSGMSLAFLAFVDRAAISEAAPLMMRDLHMNKAQMGYVFSAFGLTYAAFELPAGWLADRIGVRKVLTRVVLCWSAFTAATGLAWSYSSLVIIRLLFGAGEAGCYPALAKAFSIWLPRNERAHAEGWKTAIGRWGGAVSPLIVIGLYTYMSWRQAFMVLGAVGLLAAAGFFLIYRDNPQQHPRINAAELAIIEEGRAPGAHLFLRGAPWKLLARSRDFWALCIQWFCHFYGYYFYLTWLPIYLQQARGMSMKKSALFAGLPMLCAGAGTLASGYLLPPLSRRMGAPGARRLIAYLSYAGAAILLLFFTRIKDPVFAMAIMSLSAFLGEFCAPVTWVTAMDLGGDAVGTLTGAMSGLGQLGAGVAPAAIGLILTASGNNWLLTFYVSAAVYAIGGFCWMLIDPVTPIKAAEAA